MIQAQAAQMGAQAKLADVQMRAKNVAFDNANKVQDRAADLRIAATKLKTEQTIHGQNLQADAASQASAQHHDMTKTALGLGAASRDAQMGAQADMAQHATGLQADLQKHASGLANDRNMQVADHLHQQSMAANLGEQARVGRKRGGRVKGRAAMDKIAKRLPADFGPPAVAPDGHVYTRHIPSGIYHRVDAAHGG